MRRNRQKLSAGILGQECVGQGQDGLVEDDVIRLNHVQAV